VFVDGDRTSGDLPRPCSSAAVLEDSRVRSLVEEEVTSFRIDSGSSTGMYSAGHSLPTPHCRTQPAHSPSTGHSPSAPAHYPVQEWVTEKEHGSLFTQATFNDSLPMPVKDKQTSIPVVAKW